jgi:hypothetical protein
MVTRSQALDCKKKSQPGISCLGTCLANELFSFENSHRQGVTKRCRLSLLTNSAFVYDSKCGGTERVVGVSANQYSCAHHVTWSPNKLWRSIFNLCSQAFNCTYLLFMVLSVSWEERPAQGPVGQHQEAGPEVRRRPVPNLSHAPPLPGKPHKPFGLGRGGGGRGW